MLPVRVALFRRKLVEEVACQLCGIEEESIEHLFFQCELARKVWMSWAWTFRLGNPLVLRSGFRVG